VNVSVFKTACVCHLETGILFVPNVKLRCNLGEGTRRSEGLLFGRRLLEA